MNKIRTHGSLQHELLQFIGIGIFITILSIMLMSVFYNLLGMGYWGASAISYFVSSLISFFLNKKMTFKNDDSSLSTGTKFFINIALCYIVAFLIAKPIIRYLLLFLHIEKTHIVEQSALLFGVCLFSGLNFIGQKYFVFFREGSES